MIEKMKFWDLLQSVFYCFCSKLNTKFYCTMNMLSTLCVFTLFLYFFLVKWKENHAIQLPNYDISLKKIWVIFVEKMWKLAVWSNRFHINPIILGALMAKALRQHPLWMSDGVLTLCIHRSFSLLPNSCIKIKCLINLYNEDLIINSKFGYLLWDKFQCSFLQ